MTSWNSAIPNVNNVPANDATAMQQNFGVLDAAFQVDHTPLSQSTNQGMHKQVTFPQPPATLPFVPVAQQSWEYEKLLVQQLPADPFRSFLEYQSAGPAPNNIIPLSFKAWGIFNRTALAPFINIVAGFNIDPVTTSWGGTINIGFLSNMPSLNFMVFYSVFSSNNFNIERCSAKAVNSVSLTTIGTINLTNQVFLVVL